jgi:hypothetical protein
MYCHTTEGAMLLTLSILTELGYKSIRPCIVLEKIRSNRGTRKWTTKRTKYKSKLHFDHSYRLDHFCCRSSRSPLKMTALFHSVKVCRESSNSWFDVNTRALGNISLCWSSTDVYVVLYREFMRGVVLNSHHRFRGHSVSANISAPAHN